MTCANLKIICIFLFFIIGGCNKSKESRIEISFSSFKDVELDEIANILHVVKLDDSAHFIGEIKKMRIWNDKIYIYEIGKAPSISCFDLVTGKFCYILDRYGKGPYEYRDFEDFCIDEQKGQIQIFERTQKRCINYSASDGSYVNEFKLDNYVLNAERTSRGDYILWCDDQYEFQVYDSMLAINKYHKFDYNPVYDMDISYRFCNYRDTIWFTKAFCDDIYYYTDKIHLAFHVDLKDKKVPDDILKIPDMERKFEKIFEGGYALAVCNLHFSGGHLFFSFTDTGEQKIKSVIVKEGICNHIDRILYDKLNSIVEVPTFSGGDTLYSLVYSGDYDGLNPTIISYVLK